jgi:hypothetical protein
MRVFRIGKPGLVEVARLTELANGTILHDPARPCGRRCATAFNSSGLKP